MNIPACAIEDLPPPELDHRGWPWTDGSCGACPKISIVTPSFNQAQYVEETIRSVLLQGYPNLEFFIFDGGSKDNSVAIIKKYEPWLTGWVSERDRGQSDAINKGFAQHQGGDPTHILASQVVVATGFNPTKKRAGTCEVLHAPAVRLGVLKPASGLSSRSLTGVAKGVLRIRDVVIRFSPVEHLSISALQ